MENGYLNEDRSNRFEKDAELKKNYFADPVNAICAFLMLPISYCYAQWMFPRYDDPYALKAGIWLLLFTAGFIAVTETLFKGRKRSTESVILLACLSFMSIKCDLFGTRVWEFGEEALVIHVLAVWYVLARSGQLLETRSDHLILLDGVFGFIIYPFRDFILRFRTMAHHVSANRKERKREGTSILLVLLFSAVAIVLFINAAILLYDADESFREFFSSLSSINWEERFSIGEIIRQILLVIVAELVSAYLFGLLGGSARRDYGYNLPKADAVNSFIRKLTGPSGSFWAVVMFIFSAMYTLFLFLQGKGLYEYLTDSTSADFLISSFAREGFFELCRVMCINFSLLWLALRFCSASLRESRLLRTSSTLILVQSVLFALLAMAKVCAYCICYSSLTARRIQALWLTSVLLLGCIYALYWLFTGKDRLRQWIFISAITLSLIHIY